jgi:hypothetical protein
VEGQEADRLVSPSVAGAFKACRVSPVFVFELAGTWPSAGPTLRSRILSSMRSLAEDSPSIPMVSISSQLDSRTGLVELELIGGWRCVLRADGVLIDGFTVSNGDDAVAIQSGAANVLVQNGYIGHHSHGMSIGSLGQNQGLFASVSNVTIRDITVDGAVYASRIKSWVGGQGLVSNVTYENFRLNNVT